jgi:hypothetical protein
MYQLALLQGVVAAPTQLHCLHPHLMLVGVVGVAQTKHWTNHSYQLVGGGCSKHVLLMNWSMHLLVVEVGWSLHELHWKLSMYQLLGHLVGVVAPTKLRCWHLHPIVGVVVGSKLHVLMKQ